jgi:hypothetical protein
VTLLPSTLNFGTITLGEVSASSTVTLTNGTGKTLDIRGTGIGLNFVVVGSTCPAALSPGHSCNYTINFRPLSVGTKSGQFRVRNNIKAQVVHLTGVGQH